MKKYAIPTLAALFIGASLQGEWELVTDFEDPDGKFADFNGLDNNVVGGKIWNVDAEVQGFVGAEADPAPWVGDEGNMALHVEHPNTYGGMSTAFVVLPDQDIVDGTVATLYFRWWMNKNGGHECGVCMASRDAFLQFRPPYNVGETPAERNNTIRHGYGDHQTWWRIGGEFSIQDFGFSTPNIGQARETEPVVELLGPADSGKQFLGAIPEQQQYQPGVWMEMWIIYDTENDIKMEYQVQNDGIQKQNQWAIIDADGNVEDTIDYMINQVGPTEADYPGFYMVNWVRANPNYDTQVYMDDVWIDFDGENLTTPPHGKTRSTVELDTTPRAAGGSPGSNVVTMTMAPPPEAQVGKFVALEDGTGVGQIASISGIALTLEEPLTIPVPVNEALTFVDEAPAFQTAAEGKLVNISTRGLVGEGDQAMIAGFIVREGNQTVNILVKASELTDLGVTGVLADPVLTLQRGPAVVHVNDNWEDDPAQAQLITDAWGGTSPLAAGSTSSGVVLSLGPGNWTARVNAADGTAFGGVVSLEVYEVDQDL